ncbi:chemotaxis protein CheD [Acidithiobacillus sp. AMEEHan]|uniref:chemotaxis protein CheD n=1 Tax=Acidithiobacillus sp. AMEEHan TaxID=2994951 RepID=UPI0027E4330A|nr:chemotaxis protein CheD [Acidithiobacillus sp. AMEEHan]
MNAHREIFLQPGDWYFGGPDLVLRTLLGSCIAVTLWHPQTHMGGMCHFLLPRRFGTSDGRLDGRYGEEAIAALLHALQQQGRRAGDFHCKIFGGGNMLGRYSNKDSMAGDDPCTDVPCRNIRAASTLVRDAGFDLQGVHVGGEGHRNLSFHLHSGEVQLRFVGNGAQIWRKSS